MYVCMYVCMCVCVYVCMCVCVYVCMCACVHPNLCMLFTYELCVCSVISLLVFLHSLSSLSVGLLVYHVCINMLKTGSCVRPGLGSDRVFG